MITTLQGAGPGMHADRMASIPDPEVPERAKRRRFAASYKLAILEELDRATEPGAKGAILRREGLYSSHVIEWVRARDAGAFDGVSGSRRSEKPPTRSAETAELERLRARNAKLESDLARTRTALDIMGKAHALLEQLSESADDQQPSPRPRKR